MCIPMAKQLNRFYYDRRKKFHPIYKPNTEYAKRKLAKIVPDFGKQIEGQSYFDVKPEEVNAMGDARNRSFDYGKYMREPKS